MNDKQQVLQGREALAVLDNGAFKEAMQSLKTAVLEQWKQCPVRDREGQVLLLQLAKLTDKFEGILIGMIENGKMAKHKVDLDELRDESNARRMLRKIV